MKKHLLCTSAIALGVAAAPATAQDWDLGIGGYHNAGVGYADISGSLAAGSDFDGIDTHNTGEIFFNPSVTLDNGLTFGAHVQLESQTNGDQIDESYITISGDQLGTVTIGSENSEGYRHMIGAPSVNSLGINSPSISSFIPFSLAVTTQGFRTAMISSYTEVGGNNDASRISYRTPNFNGFTLGVSYARDAFQDANFAANNNAAGSLHDIFDLGMGYSGTVGGTDLSLAARWGTGDVEGVGTAETWGIGVNVGFSGFTVGGSYQENDNPGALPGSTGWSFGASYDAPGPWAFSLSTYQGESDVAGSQEEYVAYELAASRDLGPGVNWDIYLTQLEAKNAAGGDVEGIALGTTINLSF